jgi:hypothetical protein
MIPSEKPIAIAKLHTPKIKDPIAFPQISFTPNQSQLLVAHVSLQPLLVHHCLNIS